MDHSYQNNANSSCLRAIELIQTAGKEPTPQNYELFYHYATGADDNLETELDELLERAVRPCQSELDRIYKTFVATEKHFDQYSKIGQRLSEQINKAAELVGSVTADNASYGGSLRKDSSRLTEITKSEKAAGALESIVEATQQMMRHNIEFHTRLRDSSKKIGQLERHVENIRQEVHTDSLTGVANRSCFNRLLKAEFERASRADQAFCLCMIDVDYFKKFNDTYGHRSGDAALRLVATMLKNQMREYDSVCRYGGEEFAVILPNTLLETAVHVAERICSSITEKQLIRRSTGKSMGHITVSIGVTEFRPEDSVETLIERADKCLYTAKSNGRNRVESVPIDQNLSPEGRVVDAA